MNCPDGGTCHHECTKRCWRVATCEPLSAAGWGSRWPRSVLIEHVPGRVPPSSHIDDDRYWAQRRP